jgi:UDP-N-acetylmuramyl pentapeptide synthase
MPPERVEAYTDAQAAARNVPHQLRPDDMVLLKGSRSVHLEIVAKAIFERPCSTS